MKKFALLFSLTLLLTGCTGVTTLPAGPIGDAPDSLSEEEQKLFGRWVQTLDTGENKLTDILGGYEWVARIEKDGAYTIIGQGSWEYTNNTLVLTTKNGESFATYDVKTEGLAYPEFTDLSDPDAMIWEMSTEF